MNAYAAQAAATAHGVNLSNYTRLVYAFPQNACTWWGLGSVGGQPSQAWINGSPTTAAVLAELGALLVDLHGQHETQSLLHSEAQRDILDAFAHAEAERGVVADAYASVAALRAEESSLAARRERITCATWWTRSTPRRSSRAKMRPCRWRPDD